MRKAIRLARKGWGRVSPNPMVGALIVKRGQVVAEGYHRMAGEPHAEAEALKKAGAGAKAATLYVNLEPCVHFGKTPPCVDRIIKAGVRRVVIGMKDPNPLVSGKGIAKLRKAGIKTEVGLMEEEAGRLNEIFIKYITTGNPFVILKSGMSLDGKICTESGNSRWITGEKARRFAHRIRAGVDGIVVGINTVIKDDPELTVRYGRFYHNPLKIIVDSRCRIPLNSKVFSGDTSGVVIAATHACRRVEKLRKTGARVIMVKENCGRVDIRELLTELGRKNLTSLLIEGGGEIAGSAISAGIVDKVLFFIAPMIFGGRGALSPVEGKGIKKICDAATVSRMHVHHIGEDILVEGYLKSCLPE